VRALVLLLVTIAALVLLWMRPEPAAAPAPPQLSYVTTAHQLGVVGYRDPAGAISPDGKRFAYSEGRFIRIVPISGGAPVTLPPAEGQVRYLSWTSNDTVAAVPRPPTSARMPNGSEACIVDRRLVIPCGGDKQTLDPDVDVYGPLAFSAERVYFASPGDAGPGPRSLGEGGMVALWSADLRSRKAHRVSSFSRDAYAPTVANDGTVVFKVQSYRTHLADVPAEGGPTRQLTTFQSETPSYHPTLPMIAFTYGTWRRVMDDANYPDIAQEIGTIDLNSALPADQPAEVIARSDSEDQAMAWSPNGRWIAFHTHREMSDDIWLRPAAGSAGASAKADDKRLTFLGRGAEVGWPRWSPDGTTVLLDGARKSDGKSVIYAIGVDQESGAVTSELREVRADGFNGDITHAEWQGMSDRLIAIAKEAPGRHVILALPIAGGVPKVVHRFATEHDFPGLGVSPDGRFVAFVAPAPDGYYQIFRKTIAGGDPVQVTSDPSHKTQPAWSPDGARIAFTVWSYQAVFWSFPAP
jgi:dipeptidyl aminopeptidase/acylaminoacyl peptidase